MRDNVTVQAPETARLELVKTLKAAYGEGLLSSASLIRRLDLVLSCPLIDPDRLVGDLTLRTNRGRESLWVIQPIVRALRRARAAFGHARGDARADALVLLALDWSGGCEELLVGRHPDCDVVLGGGAVSRHHARLTFRDGGWVLQDLDSKNGTAVNGRLVGRCVVCPGDDVVIGNRGLRID